MGVQSPPKRMTRARVAATRTSEPATRSARAVTSAAAKAKTARSAATTAPTRTTLKRKSPSDADEDEHEMQPAKKINVAAAVSAPAEKPTRGRGRPKKVVVEQPAVPEPTPEPEPATTVRARGRPKKAVEPPAEEPAKAAKVARTKKTTDESATAAAEPVKKMSRGRPPSSTGTTTVTKPAIKKKTVTFEEPEKENIAPTSTATRKAPTKTSAQGPSTKPSAAPTTTATATPGLRGKPVRKAASATAARAGRKNKTAIVTESGENADKPMPLSPKKVNQLTIHCVESDDELGMDENIPVRPLKKLPVKPTTRSAKPATVHKPAPAGENDENAIGVKQAETEENPLLASPAKRLPPTPWKGSIQSPARRVEGLVPAPVQQQQQTEGKTPQVPGKTGLLQSPAKRQPLNLNPPGAESTSGSGITPIKLSFLSTPAKRPPISPVKPLPRTIEEEEPTDRSPSPEPTLPASPSPQERSEAPRERTDTVEDKSAGNETPHKSPTTFNSPTRLSAVSPRDADPTLTPPAPTPSAPTEQVHAEKDQAETKEDAQEHDETEGQGEPMVVDQPPVEHSATDSTSTTPPTTPRSTNPMFRLRDKDLDPYHNLTDSESDDDDQSPVRQSRYTSAFSALPATPCPGSANSSRALQSSSRSTAKKTLKNGGLNFTPLAQQLSGWTAGPTPLKSNSAANPATESPAVDQTPKAMSCPTEESQNTFYEDEIHVHPENVDAEEDAVTVVGDDDDREVLEDLSFTEEDMALAAEANEMSLSEKEQGDHDNQDHDDSISEASQEYGDENAFPIDPTIASSGNNGLSVPAVPPVTPQRTIRRREVHTVAKVPLKPADDSTPRARSDNRCYSVSRLPATRPTERLTRSAAALSSSPCKGGQASALDDRTADDGRADPSLPVTPQKADLWSALGTPARTPRRDLDPALLQGAVIFVDVYTSEGADASGIFIELLAQMGARCVKTWSWNPNRSPKSGTDSRVGITHVVYKDGSKSTLEKVRESGGQVHCVGVSWVLDCERENQWLDEKPYYVDTSLVPRGSARRRKSMEPRSVANLNGMLVPQPMRESRGSQTAPSTPANNRRASSLWVRSPEKYLDEDEDDEDDHHHKGSDSDDDDDDNDNKGGCRDLEWGELTPVPKTPAPEAIARFVESISPDPATPSSVGSVESEDTLGHGDDHDRNEALLRTCPPPKRTTFVELGESILNKEKDERILMRLMAARRKSLQFAPKIGSPLSKSWKA